MSGQDEMNWFQELFLYSGLVIALFTYFLLKKRWMMDDEDTRLMFVFVERIIGEFSPYTILD